MYELYMGNILCPVAPSKIKLKIKNQNKTINLINGEEITILKSAGLTEITYDLLLPHTKYPFAVYKSEFLNAQFFLNEFERLKTEKKPFILKIFRKLPNGKTLFDTEDMFVSLEDYTIDEDAKQGFDVVVSIKLKQFRHYGTKIVKVTGGTASVEETRETTKSPTPKSNTTYTVVKGDCLWNIAKKYYGDGSKYMAIYEANKDKIANPSLIYAGQVLTIPGADQIKSLVANSVDSKTPSSVDSNANNRCNVTINFGGGKLLYGKVRVHFVLNGKPGTVEFPGTAKFQVDKGSVMEIYPIPPTDKATAVIRGKTTPVWSNTNKVYYTQGNTYSGKQAVINFDTTVEIFWKPR